MPNEIKCPKCGHARALDDGAPKEMCPKCGVVYAKVLAAMAPPPVSAPAQQLSEAPAAAAGPNLARLLKCKDCGHLISRTARACPRCGAEGLMSEDQGPIQAAVVDIAMPFWSMVKFMVTWALAAIPAALILLLVLFFTYSMVLGTKGAKQTMSSQFDSSQAQADISRKVLADAEKQYLIARDGGATMDRCVAAGGAAAAALQAQDGEAYKRWKGVESADCRAAGLQR